MDCSIQMTKKMSSTIQMKESQKKLEQPADVDVLVKNARISQPDPDPVVETKSKYCSL